MYVTLCHTDQVQKLYNLVSYNKEKKEIFLLMELKCIITDKSSLMDTNNNMVKKDTRRS